jgi:hypothetical protein
MKEMIPDEVCAARSFPSHRRLVLSHHGVHEATVLCLVKLRAGQAHLYRLPVHLSF